MKNSKIKNFITFSMAAILISFLLSQCSSSKKVTQLNSDEVANMVNSSRFEFVAERVNPLRGTSRILTSYYDVIVKKDSLKCFLPFFGRAYQAPIDLTNGGIQFTSTKFTYNVDGKKNNSWVITIKPSDNNDVQQLYFNIFGNGSSSLNVVSTNRDAISFSGHIERRKE